nr:PAS domain-containing protein [Arthrospira sp. PLM2.Bin9]
MTAVPVSPEPESDRFPKMLRHIPGVIYELWQHRDGHFSLPYASEKLWDIYGVSAPTVRDDASPIFAAIHPEDRREVLQSLNESATHLSPWHSTHRVLHPDGQCIWAIAHGTPERQPDGSTKWYGHLQNITNLKNAQGYITELTETQKLLKASEEKLRRIIENFNDMVFIITGDGRFSFLSPMFATVMGYFLSELINQPFAKFVHPDDLHICVSGFQTALAGEKVRGLEYRVLHQDGNYYWHSANLSPLQEEEGEISCLGIASYIHPRKQAELALRESELRLELALESSHIGLWDWNIQTNQVVFNQQWRSLLGYEQHEIDNDLEEWQSRVHPEDLPRVYEDINQHLQKHTPFYQNEHRLRSKDDCYKWVSTKGRVVSWDRQGDPVRFIGTYTDISEQQAALRERKQAEIALVQLSNQLKKAQEVARLGHWSFDLATQKITWSEEIFRLFGRSLDQKEPSFEELLLQLYPSDRTLLLERMTAAEQGTPQNFDFSIVRTDGAVRYVNCRIELETQEHQLVRLFGVVMDITERRVAELELERFFTISLDLLCIADIRGNFRRLSQAWEDILGYSLSDLEDRAFLDFVHPEDLNSTQAALGDLNTGCSVQRFTNRYRTKAGDYRYIEWMSIPQGELIYAAARDITERVQAQRQLQALLTRAQLLNHLSSEIRQSLDLNQILQTAVQAIFTHLKVDVCIFGWYHTDGVSPYWEMVQEQRKPGVNGGLGTYCMTKVPLRFQRLGANQSYSLNLQNLGAVYDEDLRAICASMGINLYFMLPIHTPGKIGGLEMGRIDSSVEWETDEIELLESLGTQMAIAIQQADIYQTSQTKSQELQQAYQELQKTQLQLTQAEKMSSLGQLVAGIAHEINNPVSFIYGNLEFVSEYANSLLEIIKLYQATYPQLTPEISELVEDRELDFIIEDLPHTIQSMKTGASRIQAIVKSLRTFSRLDESDLKAVDLHENIDNTLMILQNQLNGRGGKPEITVLKNYGNLPQFECYIGLLNQVLMNLLMNGIHAIEERRKHEVNFSYKGVINIATKYDENQGVYISVQDNGMGMSEEVKSKIFEPFFTTKSVGKGTGMGLSISYQIVTQEHQGEFHFDSQLGEGTTFTIRLPRLKPSPDSL